jgi:hypothetical protein
MRIRALPWVLGMLGLFLGLSLGGGSVSADSGAPGTRCEDLLHGPPKEVDAGKVVDAVRVNADRSVTMTVTVSWSFAVSSKPGEHVFDCVWDGQPGQASVVGSTGHPGTDCSQQGLPCQFAVTTQPLSPGTHTLCDIAKILGTWPQPRTGPAPSGSRTPAVCVKADIPGPPVPVTPQPAEQHNPGGGGASTATVQVEAAATAAPAPAGAPALPATGGDQVSGLTLVGLLLLCAGATTILVVGLSARLRRRRA